jgi:hypothetical protein
MSVLCYRREKGPRYGLRDFVAFLPNLTCSYWITITVWWIVQLFSMASIWRKPLVCLLSQISWKKLANPCGLMGTAIKCIEISICLEWGFSSKLILRLDYIAWIFLWLPAWHVWNHLVSLLHSRERCQFVTCMFTSLVVFIFLGSDLSYLPIEGF